MRPPSHRTARFFGRHGFRNWKPPYARSQPPSFASKKLADMTEAYGRCIIGYGTASDLFLSWAFRGIYGTNRDSGKGEEGAGPRNYPAIINHLRFVHKVRKQVQAEIYLSQAETCRDMLIAADSVKEDYATKNQTQSVVSLSLTKITLRWVQK